MLESISTIREANIPIGRASTGVSITRSLESPIRFVRTFCTRWSKVMAHAIGFFAASNWSDVSSIGTGCNPSGANAIRSTVVFPRRAWRKLSGHKAGNEFAPV